MLALTTLLIANNPISAAILVLSTSDQVAIYSRARDLLGARTTLEVAPFDHFSDALRREVLSTCAGDGACFARKVRDSGIEVELLLAISLAQLDTGELLSLRLVDMRTEPPSELGLAVLEVPIGTSALRSVEDVLAKGMPDNIWGQVGAIAVTTEPPGAEVRLGDRACISPCTLERLPPGDHRLEVRKEAHLAQVIQVLVRAGQQGETEVVLDSSRAPLISRRTLVLSAGITTASLGLIVTAWTLQHHFANSRSFRCYGPEDDLDCRRRAQFTTLRTVVSGDIQPGVGPVNEGGVLALPLGLGLLTASGGVLASELLQKEDEMPWLGILISVASGVALYAALALANPGDPRP